MLLAGNIAKDGLRLEVLHNLHKVVFDVKSCTLYLHAFELITVFDITPQDGLDKKQDF